jgi:uncharacterized protein (DUF2249 family)
MGSVVDASHDAPRTPRVTTETGPITLTLRDEHALLLGEVTTRVQGLVREAEGGRWPQQQLQGLLDYLHLEVLRHVIDVEWLVFRTLQHAPEEVHRLGQDRVDLRSAIDELTDTATSSRPSEEQASRAARHVLAGLQHHISVEESLLDAHPEAPSTASLGRRPHAWFALTAGSVINLDDLPGPTGVDATMGRLLRLRAGEQVELRGSTDPRPVWGRLALSDPGGYGFAYLQEGPHQWRVQITRRSREWRPRHSKDGRRRPSLKGASRSRRRQ